MTQPEPKTTASPSAAGQTGDRIAVWLRCRYIVGLTVLLVILLVGQVAIQFEVKRQAADAELINIAGRQRMLSQKIVKSAEATAWAARTRGLGIVGHTIELMTSLKEFGDAHDGLWRGNAAAGLPPAPEHIAERFERLHPSFLAITQSANEVLELCASGLVYDEPALSLALTRLHKAARSYLPAMHETVSAFQRESEDKLAQTMRVEFCLFLACIVVIFAEVFLVFEPAVRGVRNRIAEVHAARLEAEAAAQAMSDFLANMSHEIRTPMTAILGYADLLTGEDQSRSEQLNAAQIIQRQGQHLLDIINDILDAAKLDAGKFDIRTEPTSLIGMLAEVRDLLRCRAEQAGLDLMLDIQAPTPVLIDTDALRLRQILVNLAGNAVKFTERGSVTIHAEIGDEGEIRLGVFDTGPGMTPEEAQKLFEPFVQSDSSTTRRHGGTGLGLSISVRLAELLGGRVWFEENPGGGSRFWVSIPVGIEEPKMLRTHHEIDDSLRSARAAAVAPAPTSGLEGLDILLAEDGIDNQRLIRHVLEKAGARVEVVENGQLAVEAAIANPFHVVLMDMQMPVMDGYTAAGELRKRGYTGPVIALTAHTMIGDREKCLAAGCSGFLSKPIDKAKLINTCRTHGTRAAQAA